MPLTVSSSDTSIDVTGRLAWIIGYLVKHGAALDVDAEAGKVLIRWGEGWRRLRREEEFPPMREPIGRDGAP